MSENKARKESRRLVKISMKVRFIIVTIVVIAVIGTLFAFWYRYHEKREQASAHITVGPDIQSIPGAGDPSARYIQQQNLQNQLLAEQARQQGKSSVPTITRPAFVGNPSAFATLPTHEGAPIGHLGAGGLDCPTKVLVMFKPNPANCTPASLERARQAGVKAQELACQHCPLASLRAAGYLAGELKNMGYSAKKLSEAGYPIDSLAQAGFDAGALTKAGFNPGTLKQAGYTAGALKSAGLSAERLRAAGFQAAALKAAGYTPEDLKKAGYTAAELKAAGDSAAALKKAGFNAQELEQAGFSRDALKQAGFDDQGALKTVCSHDRLKQARLSGVSPSQLVRRGCSLASLKEAGFSPESLRSAGFNAAQLKAAGFNAKQLKKAGFSAAALKKAGYTAGELKAAGYSADELRKAGFDSKSLKAAGFSPTALKQAGFSASQLKNASFNAGQLAAAGFTPEALHRAGFSAKQLRAAGFSPAELKAAGYSAKQLEQAGYSNGDLVRAGFTPNIGKKADSSAVTKSQDSMASPERQDAVAQRIEDGSTNRFKENHEISPEKRLAALVRASDEQRSVQASQDFIQQMQAAMLMQAKNMVAEWNVNQAQSFQKASVPAESTVANRVQQSSHRSSVSGIDETPHIVMKAGSILFAVLDTSINTDEESPIMATIVSGRLKGAKLIGQFTRVNRRVLLSFNLINDPNYDKSIPINAVAIDPSTARTALSGQVNNHYLLKYGTTFATAFLSGLSNAILRSSTSMQCSGFNCVTNVGPLDTRRQVIVGLGTAGEKIASDFVDKFNSLPPTVKIHSGIGMGILVMSDLQLPIAHLSKENTFKGQEIK